ncbi:MAG: WbuC family cupin fold metalloprotein [Muribaculaceae bacterium]|nr:WbuC family cupin fold metalloprotein [Muribaculaceae bacterium]
MKLNNQLFDKVSAEAATSPRKRMNLDMRNSADDKSQRMLNALEPETVLPIHRHRATSETCIVLRGKAEEIFYDDLGNETERVMMQPGSDCCGVDIAAGRWHKIVSLEPGTVIFEAKDGPYEPTSPEDILTV